MTTSSPTTLTATAWAPITISLRATATAPNPAPHAPLMRATSSSGPTVRPRHTSSGCHSAVARAPHRARSTPTSPLWSSGAMSPPSCCRTRASRRAPRTAPSASRSPTLRSTSFPSSALRLPPLGPTSAPIKPPTSPPPTPTPRACSMTRDGSCSARRSGRSWPMCSPRRRRTERSGRSMALRLWCLIRLARATCTSSSKPSRTRPVSSVPTSTPCSRPPARLSSAHCTPSVLWAKAGTRTRGLASSTSEPSCMTSLCSTPTTPLCSLAMSTIISPTRCTRTDRPSPSASTSSPAASPPTAGAATPALRSVASEPTRTTTLRSRGCRPIRT
mmetsp:Transcript_22771/g.73768  ORF Transcript_22771/g.73768 Transcript_22771/m.73768 type:complete len:331 (+) Transcript_22771:847-1839(+)